MAVRKELFSPLPFWHLLFCKMASHLVCKLGCHLSYLPSCLLFYLPSFLPFSLLFSHLSFLLSSLPFSLLLVDQLALVGLLVLGDLLA